MKAVVMNSFGGPEVLRPADLPVPEPAENEVLIKVHAAGVNPVDYKIRSGHYQHRFKVELPAVPGRDVSGTVVRAGRKITALREGEEVYAFLQSRAGGYADFAVARDNEVARKPASIDHAHAAGVPLAAVTAWQALFEHGRLQAGQRVLIHGAGGGVGHFAVQFAKARGGHVIATVGPEDADLVRNLGAFEVIDYKAVKFEEQVRDVDLVIDLIGGEIQQRSWQTLKKGGVLVSTLDEPAPEEAKRHEVRALAFMAKPTRAVLAGIAELIDQGQVRVVIQKTYPLDEAPRAQDELEHKHSAGKRVLVVA